MSEQATNTNPAPASDGGGGAEPLHSGMPFHEFTAAAQARVRAAQEQRTDQPPPVAKTVQPPATQPQTLEKIQSDAAQEAQQLGEQPPEQPAKEEQQQQQPQLTQEDIDLLAKAKEWLASETMPEEFAKKLMKLKNGEDVEYESWEDAQQGRMRQREFIRSQQKFDKDRQAWEQREGAYKGHFEAVFNDERDGEAGAEAIYDIFTRQGKFKQLWKLGSRLANIEQEMIDGANGVGYAIMHRLGIKDPRDHRVQEAIQKEYKRRYDSLEGDARSRATAFENERLRQAQQQTQQQSQSEEHWATQRKALEQLRPRAFEATGMDHDNPKHRLKFDTYLDAVIRLENANKVTPDHVMKAARAAQEELAAERKAEAEAGLAPKKQGQPFQPQLSPSGGGKAPGSKPKQWDDESFAQAFKLQRW